MSVTKTSHSVPSRLPQRSQTASAATSGVDTSNLSPGAAARFEKLIRSIDSFTAAVHNKSITLSARK